MVSAEERPEYEAVRLHLLAVGPPRLSISTFVEAGMRSKAHGRLPPNWYRTVPHGNETVKVTAPSPVPLAPLAAAARRTGRYTVVVSPARSPLPP